MHAAVPEIMWRAAMALSLLAPFSADIAFEIAKSGVHYLAISNYHTYKKAKNDQVMQQILWMMGSLLLWPPSRNMLNRQQETMDFFKMVIQDFEDLKTQMASDPAAKKKVCSPSAELSVKIASMV
jgi:hypothetical protein